MCLKASRLSHGVGVALQASGRPITHAQPRHRFPVGDGTGLDWLGAGGLPWGGDGCWETGFDGGSQSGRVELRSRQPRPPWVINKVALCSVSPAYVRMQRNCPSRPLPARSHSGYRPTTDSHRRTPMSTVLGRNVPARSLPVCVAVEAKGESDACGQSWQASRLSLASNSVDVVLFRCAQGQSLPPAK